MVNPRGAGVNPAGAGGVDEAAEFDDSSPVPKSQESKTSDHDYRPDAINKKQSVEQSYKQNKTSKDELPDSLEFIYNL